MTCSCYLCGRVVSISMSVFLECLVLGVQQLWHAMQWGAGLVLGAAVIVVCLPSPLAYYISLDLALFGFVEPVLFVTHTCTVCVCVCVCVCVRVCVRACVCACVCAWYVRVLSMARLSPCVFLSYVSLFNHLHLYL